MAVVTRMFGLFLLAQMATTIEVPKLKISEDLQIPRIALGTYLGFGENGIVEPTPDFVEFIAKSIDIGWRHFDTAWIYKTEKAVGQGIMQKINDRTITRSEIFVTTKLWNNRHRRKEVVDALRDTLKKMGLDYVDLFLMHWPMGINDDHSYTDTHYMETWRGMEDCQREGIARSIGVSNFNMSQLSRVIREGTIRPAVLQIENHLQCVQRDLVEFAQSHNLAVMGYSPFVSLLPHRGDDLIPTGPTMDDPHLLRIAKKHGKSVPQIVLRWLVQRNIIPVVKTTRISRLEENLNVFDFKLDKYDMDKLYSYDAGLRYTLPSFWQNHPYYPFAKIETPITNPLDE